MTEAIYSFVFQKSTGSQRMEAQYVFMVKRRVHYTDKFPPKPAADLETLIDDQSYSDRPVELAKAIRLLVGITEVIVMNKQGHGYRFLNQD